MNKLIIIGAGGHGRVVADIAQKIGRYQAIEFLDDGDMKETMGLPIIGKTDDIDKYIEEADFFVAIGNCKLRGEIIERLVNMGASIPTLIHPSAVIGACVEIDIGTVIMAGAVVNPCTKIGKGVIINTCSSIDHDCVIDDYCHLAVGGRVAGTVKIGANTFIGAGAVVKNNLTICEDCIIGAGAVLVKDIVDAGTYVGIPAKRKL